MHIKILSILRNNHQYSVTKNNVSACIFHASAHNNLFNHILPARVPYLRLFYSVHT